MQNVKDVNNYTFSIIIPFDIITGEIYKKEVNP